MDLKIDLLKKQKKSLFRVIFGILMFSLAIIRVIKNRDLMPFDWIYFGIFSLNGVFHFIEGVGYSFESFFGKAYILINLECISLKTSVFKKEQCINWDEIKSIDYNRISEKLRIEKTDNANVIVDFYKFGYSFNDEIKGIIDHIAKEKNIQLNI